MKDWKTTLGGIFLGIGTPLASYGEGAFKIMGTLFAGLGAVLLGYQAKDKTE